MYSPKISFIRLFLLAFLVNFIAQAIHETGHLLVYQAYHRNPTWGFIGLVQLWNTQPQNPNNWVKTSTPEGEIGWLRLNSLPTHKTEIAIAGAAGPATSLSFVLLGLWAAYNYRSSSTIFKYTGFMLGLLISLVMTLYYLRSPLRTIGDEYDVATYFGVDKFVVEIPFALIFVACLVFGLRLLDSRRIRLKWLAATLLGSVSSGILLMISDGWIREAVNKDNPFFQSSIGYPTPVLIVYFLAFFGILIWQHNTNKILNLPGSVS